MSQPTRSPILKATKLGPCVAFCPNLDSREKIAAHGDVGRSWFAEKHVVFGNTE